MEDNGAVTEVVVLVTDLDKAVVVTAGIAELLEMVDKVGLGLETTAGFC